MTKTLSHLLLDALPQNYQTDCILPVPMHTKRLRERGFHHTLWLARSIRDYVDAPIDTHLCEKIHHTASSASLNAKQRKNNTQQVYRANPSTYQHVTLLDDLFTTGETANTLARVLKESGVQKVALWCCARALMNNTALPE